MPTPPFVTTAEIRERLSKLIADTSVEDVLCVLAALLSEDGYPGEADLVSQAASL